MKALKNLTDNIRILGQAVKSLYLFKSKNKKYLQKTDISLEEMEKFLNTFNTKRDYQKSLVYKKTLEDVGNNFFIKLLRVKSFYNNHNLFKVLYAKTNVQTILFDMRTLINNQTINQRIKLINLEELKKNIEFLNNSEINLLVLETALRLSNNDIYNIIDNLLDFKQQEKKILETMCCVMSNYGHEIKDKPLSQKIREYINKDNFYKYNHKSYLNDRYEHYYIEFYPLDLFNKKIININSFLNINSLDILANNSLSYEAFFNLHLTEKQIKKVFKKVNEQKDYTGLALFYLSYYMYDTPIGTRIKFLITHNLMNEQVWETVYNDSYIRSKIFNNYEKLTHIIPEENLKTVLLRYKENLSQFSLNLQNYSDFFKNYPYDLSELELRHFLIKSDCHYCCRNDFEDMSIEMINAKYLGQLNAPMYYLTHNKEELEKVFQEEKSILNLLYERYSQYMNNKDFFFEIVTQSKNDLFVYCYLNRYFTSNNNESLKRKIVNKLQTFHSICLFRNTLKWVIENNLLNELLSDISNNNMFVDMSNNYLVPILLDKYKVNSDIFIEKSCKSDIINYELFYFILNNYEVSEKSKHYVCQKIYQYNVIDLAEEFYKRNISPHTSLVDNIKNCPNEAGNILLKSYLKKKLENKYLTKSIKEKVHKI